VNDTVQIGMKSRSEFSDDADGRYDGAVESPLSNLIVQLWQISRRWKWLISAIVISVLLVGLLVTVLATRQYTATARIEISRQQKNVTKVEGLDDQNVGKDIEFYQTQYGLLEARSLAERVAKSLRLADNNRFFSLFGDKSDDSSIFSDGTAPILTVAERTKRQEKATKILLEHISVAPLRGSSLVNIGFTSPSPVLSARIANMWTAQFIQSSMDRRFASTADARTFLEGKLNQVRERLEKSERDLATYASDKQIISLNSSQSADGKTIQQKTLVGNDLEALNLAYSQAYSDRVAAESRMRSSNARGSSTSALGNATINALRQRRALAASEYAKLMIQFEPGYPAARALASEIANLDGSLAREEGRVQASISGEYNEALAREKTLLERVNALKSGFNAQRRDTIQFNIYQREVDTNRQIYDGLLQRYKEIGVAGIGTNNVSIVDPAQVPKLPSSPNLPLNLALALLLGVALSAAVVFVIMQVDESIKDPSQVPQQLGTPLLGAIPGVDEEKLQLGIEDRKSTLSDAYLSVQTNLSFATAHGAPKSMALTSTEASEGKSHSAFALAGTFARTGRSILLIDADMRSPSVSTMLDMHYPTGLSNYLAGDDDWKSMVHTAPNRKFSVMLTGPQPPNAAELLTSNRLRLLMEETGKHFDHIIVDSPPVLGLADAPLIASMVEGVIFVVEANRVKVRGIQSAIARLRSARAQILGIVLTKFDEKMSYNDYGYRYGYGYGQTKSDD
jgi:polysaccharide biosynthesis transport protein